MRNVSRRSMIKLAAGAAMTATSTRISGAAECLNFLATDEGPFYPTDQIEESVDLTRGRGSDAQARGVVMHIGGKILDNQCKPLAGASVVIWQADDAGLYRHDRGARNDRLDPNFKYFARAITSADGSYRFKTIAPKPYEFAGLKRARHVHFEVRHRDFGRLTSEMYFAGDDDDTRRETDDVWHSLDADRRRELIVSKLSASQRNSSDILFPRDEAPAYRFDMGFDQPADGPTV